MSKWYGHVIRTREEYVDKSDDDGCGRGQNDRKIVTRVKKKNAVCLIIAGLEATLN